MPFLNDKSQRQTILQLKRFSVCMCVYGTPKGQQKILYIKFEWLFNHKTGFRSKGVIG